jgi:hypothetical protein
MPIHAAVLDAALRLCRHRGGWTFRPAEIVAALPGLNAASVRTHVMSRCCVNAPPHHAHRWPYFRRIDRGVYQILPAVRGRRPQAAPEASLPPEAGRRPDANLEPEEAGVAPVAVEIRENRGRYVAESPALPGGVAGASLASVLSLAVGAVREKLEKEGGPPGTLRAELRLRIDPLAAPASPLIAAYAKDIDRTLIDENLRVSVEERLERLQSWVEGMDAIRGAARRSRRGGGEGTGAEET